MNLQNVDDAPTSQSYSRAGSLTNNPGAMTIVTVLFFMWGFLTALNDIIIPHLKSIFDLSYTQAMLVQFCFFTAYFIFSVPFGKLMERVGFKSLMITGLCIAGVGAWLFIPAAKLASFPFFLLALTVLAAGITALQVSANPYVSILGAPRSAPSRLNLAQAFNSLGTTVAPLLGKIILSSTVLTAVQLAALEPLARQDYRVDQASSVIVPYVILGSLLFLIAVGISLAKLPQIDTAAMEDGNAVASPTGETWPPTPQAEETAAADDHSSLARLSDSIWSFRHTVLGALAIFVYVGAEVSIGSFLVNYFSQPDTGNYTQKVAATLVPFYWGGAMIGRFLGSLIILPRVPGGRALGYSALAASVLVLASILTTGQVAVWTILAVGLFNSIMFPNIFTLGIARLGPLTGAGSGLLIAAIVGGAIIPLAQGKIADTIGIHHAFVLPILCYAYLAYYGFAGSIPAISRRLGAALSGGSGSDMYVP